MSDWFRSIPYGLDGLAQAAKVRGYALSEGLGSYSTPSFNKRRYLHRFGTTALDTNNRGSSWTDTNGTTRN